MPDINGRYVSQAYAVAVPIDYYSKHAEEIKRTKGFIGRTGGTHKSKDGKREVVALYFATLKERDEFAAGKEILWDLLGKDVPTVLKKSIPVFSDWYRDDEWRAWYKTPIDPKLDVVSVSEEDANRIQDSFVDALLDGTIADGQLSEDRLPLPNFVLKIRLKDRDIFYEYHYKNGVLGYTNYAYEGEKASTFIILDHGTPDQNDHLEYELVHSNPEFRAKDMDNDDGVNIAYMTFMAVNWFIRNLPSSYSKSQVKVKQPKQSKKQRKRSPHVVYFRTEYNMDLKGKSVSLIKKEIHCLCWGVRGHVRHYKNGKETFIKPYRKGKMRDNPEFYEAKTYKKANSNDKQSRIPEKVHEEVAEG